MSETSIRFGSNAGQPVTRRDGIAKVTGAATFAADNHPDGLLHAVYVPATIARGRVVRLDTAAARAHPGVVEVFTPENRPALAGDPDAKPFLFAFRTEVLQSAEIRYANQPIALVVAETVEAATEAARLVVPHYEALPPRLGLDADAPYKPESGNFGRPAETIFGDVDAGHLAARHAVDLTY